jgi:FlaG/FlaF family flagellin (archaellin)
VPALRLTLIAIVVSLAALVASEILGRRIARRIAA